MSADNGRTTELRAGGDEEMSEDSGYLDGKTSSASSKNTTISETVSESGDSTVTMVDQEHSSSNLFPNHTDTTADSAYSSLARGSNHKQEGTQKYVSNQTQENLPKEIADPNKRTETWVQETFEIFVKNLDGKTHTIEVEKYEEVSKFRQKVCTKLGVPDQQQRLTSQEGKTLQDGQSLYDYNIRKHSTIYCQGRLRGGFVRLK